MNRPQGFRAWTAAALLIVSATLWESPARGATCLDSSPWLAQATRTAKWHHSAIWDPVTKRMIVYGGWDGVSALGDVEAFDPATNTWTTITTTGAPARYSHTAIYDPVGRRMIVFGGWGSQTAPLWSLSLTTWVWTQLTPAGSLPPMFARHVAVYDPADGSMIVAAGDPSLYPAQTWRLSLASMQWTRLEDIPSIGHSRAGAVAILDPVGRRMIVFGGRAASYGTLCYSGQWRDWDDIAVLSLAGTPTWSSPVTTGFPPALSYASAFYEPQCNRMVVFGGVSYSWYCDGGSRYFDRDNPTSAVMALDLNTLAWTAVSTSGGPPPPRGYHAGAYDPDSRKAYFHGGGSYYEEWDFNLGRKVRHETYLNDAWSLGIPDVTPPAAITDLGSNCVLTTAVELGLTSPGDDGNTGTAAQYDARYSTSPITEANFASATQVNNEAAPEPAGTSQVILVSGLTRCRWYYFAVKTRDESSNWSAISNVFSARTHCSGTGSCGAGASLAHAVEFSVGLDQPYRNPATGFTRLSYGFSPSHEGLQYTLAAFDVAGRQIRTISTGVAATGAHATEWDMRSASNEALRPGIYFVRLTVGPDQFTRHVAITSR